MKDPSLFKAYFFLVTVPINFMQATSDVQPLYQICLYLIFVVLQPFQVHVIFSYCSSAGLSG